MNAYVRTEIMMINHTFIRYLMLMITTILGGHMGRLTYLDVRDLRDLIE